MQLIRSCFFIHTLMKLNNLEETTRRNTKLRRALWQATTTTTQFYTQRGALGRVGVETDSKRTLYCQIQKKEWDISHSTTTTITTKQVVSS